MPLEVAEGAGRAVQNHKGTRLRATHHRPLLQRDGLRGYGGPATLGLVVHAVPPVESVPLAKRVGGRPRAIASKQRTRHGPSPTGGSRRNSGRKPRAGKGASSRRRRKRRCRSSWRATRRKPRQKGRRGGRWKPWRRCRRGRWRAVRSAGLRWRILSVGPRARLRL